MLVYNCWSTIAESLNHLHLISCVFVSSAAKPEVIRATVVEEMQVH